MRETDQGTERGTGNGGSEASGERRGEVGEASSRSIAKHWAELVYRRIEGESERVGEGNGGRAGGRGRRERRGRGGDAARS